MGKDNVKNKILSIMGFGLKLMAVGMGIRLAAILCTCQNQMRKGKEWDFFSLFCVGKWDLNLIFGWKR